MPNKTKIELDSVDITIDHRDKKVSLFDWSLMQAVEFYSSDWEKIKTTIDNGLDGACDSKAATKADRWVMINPRTGDKHTYTEHGLVPICKKCDKAFAAYEKDDEGFICRSCRLPSAKDNEHLSVRLD